jgi:tetratricopeptide (TPR) repeat protein/tRNA A-37 threonylcarbamoyl transferase component Bud32
MIGQTISHYRILRKLGEGGMGVVYLAEDTVLGRHVAIKTLTEDGLGRQHFRTRFLREAQAVSTLSHANIATIYEYGETEQGNPYIVMEFVRGETLADLIRKHNLSLERAVEIIIDVARALGEAHRHGIVHRDIKPSNIAITENGQVKVLDFGLAKQIESDPENHSGNHNVAATQTREGVMLGTPMYISPEQAMGVSVDARSDLFSLGSVLYECVTGQPPFGGSSPIEICAKVIRDDPAPPSSLNPQVAPDLDRISLKSLAKKPDERYQSAELCIEDLRAAEQALRNRTLTHDNGVAGTSTNAPKLVEQGVWLKWQRAFTSRRPLLAAILAIVTVMTAIGLWQYSRPKPYKLDSAVQALYDQGVRAMQQGAVFRASKNFEQVVEKDEGFALGHARLAEAYAELDFSDKAMSQLLRATQLVPDPSRLETVDRLRLQAVTEVVNRNFSKAVELYKNLVEVTSDAQKPQALIDLGRAYQKNDQPEMALQTYLEASRLDPAYAAAFVNSGVICGRLQRWIEADSAFEKAAKLFDTNNEIEGLAEIGLQKAVIFTQLGKVSDAEAELKKALQKSIVLEHQDKHIRVLLNLSNNAITAGNLALAKDYAAEALTLAQNNKMENLTIQGLIDIGNRYFIQGNHDEAERYFREAIDLAQRYKAARGEARANLSLASLKTHQNDPEAVRDYSNRAVTFFKRGGYRKELGQAYVILGHAFDQTGDYEAALATFKEQLDAGLQANDQQQVAWAKEGTAVVLNHLQRYPEALISFQEQYEIVKGLKTTAVVGYAAMNIGTMNWQLGKYEVAADKNGEALQIAASGPNQLNELEAWARTSRAQMLLSRLDYKGAIEECRLVLKALGPAPSHISIQATSTLGLAETLSGAHASGLRTCQAAVDQARKLKDPLPLSRALLALAQAELAAKKFADALRDSAQVQPQLTAAKHHECEWRAWLIQAQANASLGNRPSSLESASHAAEVLATLQQQWGRVNYEAYSARPDIQIARNQLNQLRGN